MNVLFQIRNDYTAHIAGDSIQMQKTKEYLEKLGIRIDISTKYNIDLKEYDIVHIFNTIRINEPYKFAQNAMSQGKPYVLSTIYWNMINYIKNSKETNSSLEWWSKYNDLRKEILNNAAALLPNSNLEMDMLKNDFHIDKTAFIIPNGSDKFFYNANPQKFISMYGVKDFVLCVGRICHRKNQFTLINSLKNTGLKLVLIGPNSDAQYYEMCKNTADDNIIFIDQIKHYELPSAYAAAKVHVLPSWFETPGLSSLEAGLAGCNVVTTDRGSTKEYFMNMVNYCNPSSEDSINKSILDAYNKPKGDILRNHILNNYVWDIAANKTLEAYKKVLNVR